MPAAWKAVGEKKEKGGDAYKIEDAGSKLIGLALNNIFKFKRG